MPARGYVVFGAAIAALLVSACDSGEAAKQPATPQERIAQALDPCGSGRGAFAQNVCGNDALAALDGEIREALVAEAASVSDAGVQMLVQNQQRWREAQRVACGITDPEAAPAPEQQTCLETQFRARIEEARTAVQEVGGYTFQRVELVDAAPVTAQIAEASGLGDEAPPAFTRQIRFPRIDGPQTPEIQRFNALVAQQPQTSLEDATEEVVGYQIAYAGPEIVSVRFDMYENALGAAHPSSSTKAVTVNMRTGELIGATDVFRANSGWQRFLTQRAVREITQQFRDYDFVPPEADVRESATKPHLWVVTEQGLVILFPPYSFGGPHALGGTEVTIPWADLRTYLNPNAPAPIRAQA